MTAPTLEAQIAELERLAKAALADPPIVGSATAYVSALHPNVILALIEADKAKDERIAAAEWREDIASAPTDGTRILAWVCSRGSIRRGHAMLLYFNDGWREHVQSTMPGELIDASAILFWQPIIAPRAALAPKEDRRG